MHNTTFSNNSNNNEPSIVRERFLKLAADRRSAGIHMPKEWPMDTVDGRRVYQESRSRDHFLDRLNGRSK